MVGGNAEKQRCGEVEVKIAFRRVERVDCVEWVGENKPLLLGLEDVSKRDA